jgi:hypothetical protein
VFAGASLRTGVAVLDDLVALLLHHLGEAQGFSRKGAVGILRSGLGVEDPD